MRKNAGAIFQQCEEPVRLHRGLGDQALLIRRTREGRMALRSFFAAGACALAFLCADPARSFAQSHPEYIPLPRIQAALYKPDSGPAPHVAFLVAHRTANNLSNIACTELAKRGFMVLC